MITGHTPTWPNSSASKQRGIDARNFNVWTCISPIKISDLVCPFNNSFPHVGNIQVVKWWYSVTTCAKHQQCTLDKNLISSIFL